MEVSDIKKVLVLGAGTMGQQIALQCAIHGYDVVLYDIDPEMLKKALKHIDRFMKELETSKRFSSAELAAARERIATSTDAAEAGKNVDLISENVPEDPALKGKVFSQFNGICATHTIFTSNTSSLIPSMFAEQSGRPDKVISLHFHPNVWDATIADVMPHKGTSEETLQVVTAFARRVGQTPIYVKREHPGYVFNTMLMAFLSSALTMVGRGVASVEDVDRSWMGVMFTPMGPFGIMDFIGLDTMWKVNSFWASSMNDPVVKKNADLLRKMLDEGKLGQKSGSGFYTYPNPSFTAKGFLKGENS
ncbi:MAG TPA: 3-hydroxyacyl-CoA dehydrogenase [Spirochaetota bacterium]|nr:3-hydroxyacyl-CoA dehydrogenase [Spirochaetota bacterium]